MKIVLAGGSGQIGTFLARDFSSRGDEVVVFSRAKFDNEKWKTVQWTTDKPGPRVKELEGAESSDPVHSLETASIKSAPLRSS